MTFLQGVLGNQFIWGIVSGIVIAVVANRVINKRGLFTYFVRHIQVGVSTDDAIFGNVRVTWNNNLVNNLFSSTVELRNESLKDFENVIVRVYTNDTSLLTEKTEIVGSIRGPQWSQAFTELIRVPVGGQPTQIQQRSYFGQREYLIPAINRGQTVRFTFLNAATTNKQPSIWLDMVHKGVKLKFRIPQGQLWGVPPGYAVLTGTAIGGVACAFVIARIQSVWLASLISFLSGWLVILPGVLSIKFWRWMRTSLGD